jgi:hypothetical protein
LNYNHGMAEKELRTVEYNGVVLSVVGYSAYHVVFHGPDRWNWELRFRTGGATSLGVQRRLKENGKVISGLPEMAGFHAPTAKVISQCFLDVAAGKWAFWVEELTETERLREEFREIAEGV